MTEGRNGEGKEGTKGRMEKVESNIVFHYLLKENVRRGFTEGI